jgi:hypothetical protein
MTDRAQFEAMLEALINDDQQAAKEIFHNIVVGKSREIYEELLESDFGIAGSKNKDSGNPYGESMEEEEESMEEEGMEEEEEESAGEEEGEEEEGEEEEDGKDDMDADMDTDSEEEPADMGDMDGEEDGDIEDRVMDLEDALEDLKAEFEQLLQGEEHEEENEPGVHGDGMPMHDIGAEMHGDDSEMETMDELNDLMEYVNRIGAPYESGKTIAGSTEGQHVGAQAGSVTSNMNKKSAIDGHMVNDMGGTTSNIAQNHVEVKGDAGTRAGGTKGGLASPDTKPLIGDTMNRVGGDAGKKAFRDRQNGYGGVDSNGNQKKAQGKEVGAKDSNGRGESNTQSVLRPRK